MTKISALTPILGASTAGDDVFAIVDLSANETKKITRDDLLEALGQGSAGLKVSGVKVIGAQVAAIAGLTVTASTGSLPTPDGSVTIAVASSPTVAELLEYCVELEAKLEAALSAMRAHGIIAT